MRSKGKARILALLVLLLTTALMLAACGGGLSAPGGSSGEGDSSSNTGSSEKAPQQAASNEIVIGSALPLTGEDARVGSFFKDGYETAVKAWNEKGGVKVGDKQLPIRLIILDNQSDPTNSVRQYERLVNEEKVNFLLGSYSTVLVQADSVVAERYKTPYVNGGGAASEIYATGNKYLFGLLSSIENLARTQMDWLKDMQDAGELQTRPAKIALVWENTDHGKDFQKGVQAYAKEYPDRFQVVLDESFELNGQDFTSLLTKVKASNADLFMSDAHLQDFILMHRQYHEQGLYHQMITYGARGPEKDARDQLGVDAVAGIISATWWSPLLPYPEVKDFVEFWQQTHDGATPAWYHALSYETANVLFKAIEMAGTLDKEKVRDTLVSYDQPSILPGHRAYFAENGQIDNPFVIVQNTADGKQILIYPPDIATGDPIIPLPQQ